MATKAKAVVVKAVEDKAMTEELLFGEDHVNDELIKLSEDVFNLKASLENVVRFIKEIRQTVRKLNDSVEL